MLPLVALGTSIGLLASQFTMLGQNVLELNKVGQGFSDELGQSTTNSIANLNRLGLGTDERFQVVLMHFIHAFSH